MLNEYVNYMYDYVMEGSIFCLVHGFHLCSHSEPYSSLLTAGWLCPQAPGSPCCPQYSFHKCLMERILCSRYRIGTRGIKLDRPGMVPALMEECSYVLSIQIQLSSSPTHDPLPPTTPVSASGLIAKCLNGRKRPHIPILT